MSKSGIKAIRRALRRRASEAARQAALKKTSEADNQAVTTSPPAEAPQEPGTLTISPMGAVEQDRSYGKLRQ